MSNPEAYAHMADLRNEMLDELDKGVMPHLVRRYISREVCKEILQLKADFKKVTAELAQRPIHASQVQYGQPFRRASAATNGWLVRIKGHDTPTQIAARPKSAHPSTKRRTMVNRDAWVVLESQENA